MARLNSRQQAEQILRTFARLQVYPFLRQKLEHGADYLETTALIGQPPQTGSLEFTETFDYALAQKLGVRTWPTA
jgi:hypothetical protein